MFCTTIIQSSAFIYTEKNDHRSSQPGSLFDPDQGTLTLNARHYINLSAKISVKSQQRNHNDKRYDRKGKEITCSRAAIT